MSTSDQDTLRPLRSTGKGEEGKGEISEPLVSVDVSIRWESDEVHSRCVDLGDERFEVPK